MMADYEFVHFAYKLSKLAHGTLPVLPTQAQWIAHCEQFAEFDDLPIGWTKVAIAVLGSDGVWVLRMMRASFKPHYWEWKGILHAAKDLLHAYFCIVERGADESTLNEMMLHDAWREVDAQIATEQRG